MGSRNDGSTDAANPEDIPLSAKKKPNILKALLKRVTPRRKVQQTAPHVDEGAEVEHVKDRDAVQPGMANLRRMRVDDVSVPKAEIIAVPADITKEALVEVFRQHGFSRVPVYKDNLDHPLGLILLKDFALQHGFSAGPNRFSLKKLIRPVIYAPPSMPASVMLQKMQRERAHMALVIDEYGGVDGLVTIEDLIETIIGEIDDEHDVAARVTWRREADGSFMVQGVADLDAFEAEIGLRLREDEDDDEVDTLGGLVFSRKGRVPKRGEIVTLTNGIQFTVLEADARRIKRLRVRLPEQTAQPAPTGK